MFVKFTPAALELGELGRMSSAAKLEQIIFRI